MNVDTASAAVVSLLSESQAGATICPSEAARRVAAEAQAEWREAMPLVHAAVDRLVDRGTVRLSWKGNALPARSGPYRIGRAEA